MDVQITGMASGSSVRNRSWVPVMPIPRAASRMAGSTSATAVYVLVKMGGIANATRATKVGQKPIPSPSHRLIGSMIATIPNDGTARPMLTRALTVAPPRRRWPSHRAGGKEMAVATATANRSEEHTSELQSRENLVCRLLLEKKKKNITLRAATNFR